MITITINRATVEQALEALERADKISGYANNKKVITALRAALAQQAEPTPTFHVEPLKWGCRVCRIGADGKAYGYVCPRSDCPTKVTSGGVA